MEEIIISLLFLYPGALVDAFSKYLFKYSYREDETSESARIARYFVYSVMITILSIFVFARIERKSISTLASIIQALSGLRELGCYVIVSLLCALAATFLFHFAECAMVKFKSWRMAKTEGVHVRNAADTWHVIAYGEEAKPIRSHAIMRIHAGGEQQVGFVKYWPANLKEGILLTQSEAVSAFFAYDAKKAEDEERFIGDPWYTLFDPDSGSFIEIFDGDKLSKYLEFDA